MYADCVKVPDLVYKLDEWGNIRHRITVPYSNFTTANLY